MAADTQSHQEDSLDHIGGVLPIDRAVRQRWRARWTRKLGGHEL